MPRVKVKSLIKGGLLLLGLGLLGFGGTKGGQLLARSGIIDRPAAAHKAPRAGGGTEEPRKQARAGIDRELLASSIKRFKALVAGSPYFRMDWEAQAQMDALIAKLNAEELAELFATLDQSSPENFQDLVKKVGAAWMAKDPDAALRGLLEKTPRSGSWLARAAFGEWAQDHPEDAFAWLDSAELPDKPATLREELRSNALYGLVERDFELTAAEYLKMKRPDQIASSATTYGDEYITPMSGWGYLYADDPAMRGRLLEFAKTTGDARDHAELNHALLQRWPQADAVGMMNYLYELKDYQESGKIPADKRLEADGMAVAAAIDREYDQAALMWWMQQHSDSRETPAPMREAMGNWINKYPEKVQAWYDEQPPSVQRDALVSSFIPTLIQQKKFTDAAQWISGMQDAEIRQAASERLGLLWSEQDAPAAAAWKASMGGK